MAIDVWDDGDPLEVEVGRDQRDGQRRGLDDVNRILEPYDGSVTIKNAPDGNGVVVTIRVRSTDA